MGSSGSAWSAVTVDRGLPRKEKKRLIGLLASAVDVPFCCQCLPIMSCRAVTWAVSLEVVTGPQMYNSGALDFGGTPSPSLHLLLLSLRLSAVLLLFVLTLKFTSTGCMH